MISNNLRLKKKEYPIEKKKKNVYKRRKKSFVLIPLETFPS